MTNIDKLIEKEEEKLKQLKQRKKDELAKINAKQKKFDDRNKFEIGEFMLEEFSHKLKFNLDQSPEERSEIINAFKTSIKRFTKYC